MAYLPPDFDIDDALIRALVRRHAPDFADAPLGARYEGWDNVTVRLGERHAARLPRLRSAAPLIEVELRWLPHLAARLPFAVPTPVVAGVPSDLFPAPWSIVEWVEGDDADEVPLAPEGIIDLGKALAALHTVAPADAPVTDWRATPLASRRAAFVERVTELGDALDATNALAVFDAAASGDTAGRHWIHADLHALNLVTRQGRLAGIVDWGELSKGDPLIDLAQAWVLVGDDGWAALTCGYGRDPRLDNDVRFAGHSIDAATRLALSHQPAHHVPARRALSALGVWR